ncbi:MFS transporter [Methylobacterium sp. P31]
MAVTLLDVDDELAEARIGPSHRRLGLLITLVTFCDGYDTFNPAYVIHYVAQPWGLQPSQAGLLISAGLLGFLGGAIGHGAIADRLGRRGTFLAGLWIVNAFTLATALFANGFWSFCSLRFLTGLGLGVLLPLSTTFINEFAPRHASNAFSLWGVTLGWSAGGIMAGLVGVFLTPAYGWPVLYYLGALSVPLTCAAHRLLPESPKFLASRGRMTEVNAILVRLRPERAALYANAAFRSPPLSKAQSAFAVLIGSYRRISVSLWITAFMSLFAIFGLTGWIPTVMMGRGETFATSFGFGALMQATSFVGGLALALLADRSPALAPRRLAMWWFVGGLSVLALNFIDGHLTNWLLVATAGFCIVGAQHVLNNVTAGAYDTSVRASGVGMMLGVGRIGAILGPFVTGFLQQVTHGPDAVFWAIGLAALVAAGAIASLAPLGRDPAARPGMATI